MPTDKTPNDRDISALLHKNDPPQSPRELDDRIVQHARQKAEEYQEYSSSVGFKWIGGSWKTVVAVFSVSVIAISVTIQVYDGSRAVNFSTSSVESLPRESRVRDEVLSEEVLREQEVREEAIILQLPTSIQVEPQAITEISTALGNTDVVNIAVEAPAASPTINSAELAEFRSRSQSADVADSLAGTATQEVALARTDETQNSQVATPNSNAAQTLTDLLNLVEQDAVARSADYQSRELEFSDLTSSLSELVSILAEILIAADESEASRQSLADTNSTSDIDVQIERVLSVYRSNEDEIELSQLEESYQQTKERFTEQSLPETLLDAIELLESQTIAQ